MRKIKAAERKRAGNIYCSFCRPQKINAVYRKTGFCDHENGYACEQHKTQIEDIESEHYTEADYQTWLNI